MIFSTFFGFVDRGRIKDTSNFTVKLIGRCLIKTYSPSEKLLFLSIRFCLLAYAGTVLGKI